MHPAASRRQLVTWTVPVIVTSVAAPAFAASQPLLISVVNLGNVANGVDLFVRDNKFLASATSPPNTSYLATTRLVLFRVRVTQGGSPVAGASVTFTGDERKDIEGNYLIGFAPATQASNLGESPTKRTVTVTTDANGFATVAVATATYALADPAPQTGTMTVSVASGATWPAGSATFSYTVVRS